jgi:hypothetical protein
MSDGPRTSDKEPDPRSVERGGMKAQFTRDGKSVPVPLTPEEAAEMRRESEEWDQRLSDLLTQESGYLSERFLEVQAMGKTTMRSSNGEWTATLQRSIGRDGWLITEGSRPDGASSGKTRIGRKTAGRQLESAITLQLGIGLLWLRE